MSLTLFDVANEGSVYVPPTLTWAQLIASFDSDANTYAAWDADYGVTTVNGAATIWEDQIGALDMGAPLSDPTHDSDDGGHGSIAYTGGTTNTVAVTIAGSYGLALRFRRTAANNGCPICLSDNAESATGRNGLYVVDASASLQVNPNSGGDVAATDTFAVGTGWRTAMITFDGSTYRLKIDSRTAVTVGTPGAITATRLTLGRLQQAASTFFDFDGSISHVALVAGRTWTTDEEDQMVAHLGAL